MHKDISCMCMNTPADEISIAKWLSKRMYAFIVWMCPHKDNGHTKEKIGEKKFFFGCAGSLPPWAASLQLRWAGPAVHCAAWTSHCAGCPSWGAQAPGAQLSAVAVLGLCSCGSRARLLLGMGGLPRPEIKPESPALAGGFLPTLPPGRSQKIRFVGKTHRW